MLRNVSFEIEDAFSPDGRDIGEMRSSRDGLGLALLRVEALNDGKKLVAGEAIVVPTKPDWLRL